jgi:hypothetical protein
MYTEQVTQAAGITASVPPQIVNNATKTTGGIDMQLFRRAFAILEIGAVTGGGTISAKWQESTDNSSYSDLANGLANISLTGLTTANKQYTFEVRAGQITKRYVRLSFTEGGSQNVQCCAVAFGMECDHKPGNLQNDSSVTTQNVAA